MCLFVWFPVWGLGRAWGLGLRVWESSRQGWEGLSIEVPPPFQREVSEVQDIGASRSSGSRSQTHFGRSELCLWGSIAESTSAQTGCGCYNCGSFRKLGIPYLGGLIIRILLFRVLYSGPQFSETPISLAHDAQKGAHHRNSVRLSSLRSDPTNLGGLNN